MITTIRIIIAKRNDTISISQIYVEFGTSSDVPINYNIEYNKRYKIEILQNGVYINDTLVKLYDDISLLYH